MNYDPAVIVYTRKGCGPCRATKRVLDKYGVEYEERSLESMSPEGIARFREAGFGSAPIVVTRDHGSWSGHQPARLHALAERAA